MAGIWDSIVNGITGAAKWMGENKAVTELLGGAVMGTAGYLAQKEANRDLMKLEREKLKIQDELKSKYSSVPETDWSYNNLVVDDRPNLATGGILTELDKRSKQAKG